MFITIQNAIINIEEIRTIEARSNSIAVHFKKPSHQTDWLCFNYKSAKEAQDELARLKDICLNYKKN
jgi:hypothetical protein